MLYYLLLPMNSKGTLSCQVDLAGCTRSSYAMIVGYMKQQLEAYMFMNLACIRASSLDAALASAQPFKQQEEVEDATFTLPDGQHAAGYTVLLYAALT